MPLSFSHFPKGTSHRTAEGMLAIWLCDDPSRFLTLLDMLTGPMGGTLREKLIGLEQSYADVVVGEELVTLHREDALGVCLMATSRLPAPEDALRQIAAQLQERHIHER